MKLSLTVQKSFGCFMTLVAMNAQGAIASHQRALASEHSPDALVSELSSVDGVSFRFQMINFRNRGTPCLRETRRNHCLASDVPGDRIKIVRQLQYLTSAESGGAEISGGACVLPFLQRIREYAHAQLRPLIEAHPGLRFEVFAAFDTASQEKNGDVIQRGSWFALTLRPYMRDTPLTKHALLTTYKPWLQVHHHGVVFANHAGTEVCQLPVNDVIAGIQDELKYLALLSP